MAQIVRGLVGKATGGETDAKGRVAPDGQGVYFGMLKARYLLRAKPEVRRALAGRGPIEDRSIIFV